MAGYNRDIVATRKLNENRKASLGRRGDTKVREVDGRESHVNALEAYLIDVNGKAGEEYAKRVGAGTVNPLTGMPEYHSPKEGGGVQEDDDPNFPQGHIHLGGGVTVGKGERQDYDFLESLSENQLANYIYGQFGKTGMQDKMQWIEGFQEEPFEFIEEEYGFEKRGLQSAYRATMGELGSKQGALGRTSTSGVKTATEARDVGIAQSGFESSGTITQAYETQTKDLFQDYTAGMQDIGRERGTALETLTLGMDVADFDKRKAEYDEKKRQLDELYADIAVVPA